MVTNLNISKAMDIDLTKKEIISFVGGGGKTTAIFQLGKELIKYNKKVLISTTTKIFTPAKEEYDYFFLGDINKDFNPRNSTIAILGKEIKDDKLIGISPERVEEILERNIFDYILIEADGSKRKPIKAPGPNEPVILPATSKTVGVIGLDSLGTKIDSITVHRPELLLKIIGESSSPIIDNETIVKLVLHKNGIFKNSHGDKILFLNKANDEKRISSAKEIRNILDTKDFYNVVIGDIVDKKFY